ncbi:MAG: hypothetical protein H6739_12680 [Alphaproteobacteria bacterium]|nr:hypothetical protein [Alphaproteobacteria bacterium]
MATVSDDLVIEGILTIEGAEDPVLADPLQALPQPDDDLTVFRTYPGQPSAGAMTWTPLDEGRWSFRTELPRRYGALGALPRDGLWANGGWYPQLLVDGRPPVMELEAEVTLPEGVVGVLNGAVGEGGETLRWSGRAARLSLAALVDGRIRTLDEGLTLLERGPRRRLRDRELVEIRKASWPEGTPAPVVVVEAPMWRRLTRSGPGVTYLSDAAFRVARPIARVHRRGVAQGLLEAALPIEDPWAAAMAAAAMAERYAAWRDTGDLLRIAAWIPWVDALLYNGRTSFHAEIFDETFPGDPLADDLLELFGGPTPGQVLAVKLDDLYGPGTAEAVSEALLRGLSLEEAARATGVDPAEVFAWRQPYPEQDLGLDVRHQGGEWVVTVTRDAPPEAPAEPVVVEVGDRRLVWEAPQGPGGTSWGFDSRPRGVRMDPDGHVRQTDTLGDTWPARWTLVGTAYIDGVNFTSRTFEAVAAARLRRRYDTHNAYDGLLYTDEETLLGAQLRYVRYAGPLLDRRNRPFRVSVWTSPAVLSPAFRPTDAGRFALEAGVSWGWDTRVSYQFPTAGHSLWAGVDGGFVPYGDKRWGSASAGGVKLWSPHPRVVFAGRLSVGLASGEVDHRLLALGGNSALRGLPANVVVGRQRALAAVQVRTMPFRDLSIPLLWLVWLDEIQIHAGLELGAVRQATVLDEGGVDPAQLRSTYAAGGWMVGVMFNADSLGAIPAQMGLTVARAEWQSTPFLDPAPVQVLLRFDQEF